jgi:hypothetical protein
MWKSVLFGALVCCGHSMIATAGEVTPAEAAVDQVLSCLHQAASDADGDLYFSLFAEGAVFLGTDATERWSVEELESFARPYFSMGRGWTYTKTKRHILLARDGQTAWFDEMLWNETYGTCRGSGVLILVDGMWQISQYNLSIPMPNELAREFTGRILELGGIETP